MTEIKSKNYRKSRLKNLLHLSLKKMLQMGSLVIIGEYMLLNVVNLSLSEQGPVFNYKAMPSQIINLAVSEKPILRVAEAYSSIKKSLDFDNILSRQYPIQVKGARPDFRTLDMQDKEGAKVGYVVKF
ncbi:MAG: hypothetical protein AAB213_04710 [Candidatus Omnitrophota bacterium]